MTGAELREIMCEFEGAKFPGRATTLDDAVEACLKYALLNENKWAQPFVFSWPDRPIKDSARPGDNQTLRNRVTELPELFDVPHVWSGYRFYVCSKPPKPIEEIRFEESIKFRI